MRTATYVLIFFDLLGLAVFFLFALGAWWMTPSSREQNVQVMTVDELLRKLDHDIEEQAHEGD